MFSYFLIFTLMFVLPISLFINLFTIDSVHNQCNQSHFFLLDYLSTNLVHYTIQHILKFPTVFATHPLLCFIQVLKCLPIYFGYCGYCKDYFCLVGTLNQILVQQPLTSADGICCWNSISAHDYLRVCLIEAYDSVYS